MDLETEAEPQRRVSPGCQRTGDKPVRLRTKAESEGRRSPMEPMGWMDEIQLKAGKSMAQCRVINDQDRT